ncbi:helix-turn-helix transcriptional regulator [Roseomonas sp. SSH11]|uniref:Helix-turn-helix transcriptional regulator n=1 Tax=Pararoseomonas baculiformis TaxID=2820812 RepID=A0ABS4AJ49_9PROT|nr:helix-turn-helix domain-containing protein [Pararoseomonas baculiformis]MBP0446543.1 helix-turn-helix transcriptional regulator [Pararoseomonas baculiformis]
MSKALLHPDAEAIDLSAVLDALRDPIRRAIVLMVSEEGEKRCSSFLHCATKTNLTYHVARLREAGVVRVRAEGAARIVALRREELDARFPGLLDAVLNGARQDPSLPRLAEPA